MQRLSFAEYLADSDRLAKIKSNVETYFLKTLQEDQPNFEVANRFLYTLPHHPGETEFFDQTKLYNEIIEVQSSMMLVLTNTQLDIHDTENPEDELVNLCLTPYFKHWIELTFKQAVGDLLDINGNLRQDIMDILRHAGITDEMAHAGGDDLKWALLSGYITNIIGGSEMLRQTMNKTIPLEALTEPVNLYQIFVKCLHKSMASYTQNELVINSDFVANINSSNSLQAYLTETRLTNKAKGKRLEAHEELPEEQLNLHVIFGAEINLLLTLDPSRVNEVVKKILAESKLIEYCLRKYQLFYGIPDPDNFLDHLYSQQFSPHNDVRGNLGRTNKFLEDFTADELSEFQYQSDNITADLPTANQREGLILGCILWNLPRCYTLRTCNPDKADKYNELLYWNMQQIRQALNGKLHEFVPLLQATTKKYYQAQDYLTDSINLHKIKFQDIAHIAAIRSSEQQAAVQAVSHDATVLSLSDDENQQPRVTPVSTPPAGVVTLRLPFMPPASPDYKWLRRILIGAAIVVGVAAIIAAAVMTAGIILAPVGVAAAIGITGGLLFGGGVVGAVRERNRLRDERRLPSQAKLPAEDYDGAESYSALKQPLGLSRQPDAQRPLAAEQNMSGGSDRNNPAANNHEKLPADVGWVERSEAQQPHLNT